MQNLDLECAKLGRKLAELKTNGKPVEEKVFTSALGILEEQGPYACFLYLQARKGDREGEEIARKATEFLARVIAGDASAKHTKPLDFLRDLASDLDRLLFARDLLRQVFVYARYHAKARGSGGEQE